MHFVRCQDWNYLEVDQVIPIRRPVLKQSLVITFHELKAPIVIGFDPASDIPQTFRQLASTIAETAVDRLGIAVVESLDDHE